MKYFIQEFKVFLISKIKKESIAKTIRYINCKKSFITLFKICLINIKFMMW